MCVCVRGEGQRVRDTVKIKYGSREMEMELWGERQTGGLESGVMRSLRSASH